MRVYILLSVLLGLAAAVPGKGNSNNNNNNNNAAATTTTAAPTTTTATTVVDGDGYGASLASGSLSSSAGASANSDCGDDAEGYYEEYVDGNYRYIIVSGAPSHAAEYDQDHANPNVRCELWQYVKVPVTWTDSGSDSQTMGVTGYVMSGGTTYDHRSSPFGDLASYYEWDSLDPSFGHSDEAKQYHYHAVPTEWSNAADATACEHIGYMIDGAKLYGYCGVESCYVQNSSDTPTSEDDYTYTSGSDCSLDECNMMEINGEMAYVMTPNYPYVPPCLKGDLATIYGFTPE